MAIEMYCNEKEILVTRTGLFVSLHMAIESIVNDKNILLTPPLQILIEKDFHIGWGGIGVDIADYIQTESDLFLFVSLLKDAILQLMKEFPKLSRERKVILWNFYRELIIYGKKLKYNSSITIRCGDKKILHMPKLYFESLCNYILGHATYTIIISSHVKQLLQLIVNKYKPISINLLDYLTTQEDYLLLAEAIKKALEYMQKFSVKLLNDDSKNQLWEFYNELVLCSKSINHE